MSIKFHPLPSPQEMRDWDKASIKLGIPEFTLMENAAREALYVLQRLQGLLNNKHILLFMGNGNNGGDAVALARHLNDVQALPLVLHTKNLKDYTKSTAAHMQLAKNLGIPLVKIPQTSDIKFEKLIPKQWQNPHIIVDGLLGTGFKGPLQPQFEKCIQFINELGQKCFVLSLDIPSGCHAMSGKVESIGVKARGTVCFAAAKPGLVLPSAKAYTGSLYVRNIGIPRDISAKYPASFRLISSKAIAEFIPQLPTEGHKNTWGHVLVVGGSKGLSGAARLAARSALRSGVGLVSVAAPNALCYEIQSDTPDIMTIALEDNKDGYTWPKTVPNDLIKKLASFKALALGPGLGTKQDAIDFMQSILAQPARPRAVIDADALNILALQPELLSLIQDNDILTPHPGEAARLLKITSKDVQNNRVECIQRLTTIAPCTWILKGAGALLAKGTNPVGILPHDIPHLAVAGSGDVLTGCAAAFLARFPDLESLDIAAIAMCIHAHTGHMARDLFSQRGNMASDLVEFIPSAMANIINFPEVYNHDL